MRDKGISILLVCVLLMGMLYICGCVEEENDKNLQEENKKPTCTLLSVPTKGIVPLTVNFSLIATDKDGTISIWKLDINTDGTIEYMGTGNPPSTQEHIYNNPGIYTATLTVIDDDGATEKDTFVITVLKQIDPIPP